MRVTATAGKRVHQLSVQNVVGTTADGDGSYTQLWQTIATVQASVRPATGRDVEHVAGTVAAVPTHVVAFPYVAGVNTQSRLVFGARLLNVLGVQDPEERHIELVLACAEVEGSVDVASIGMLVALLGGDSFAFVAPASADQYPAGATFDKLVPDSFVATLNGQRLLAGEYVLEASARVAGAGARAKVALVDLASPNVPVVEIAFTADEVTGETKRSAAFTVPRTDTRYAVKSTTDDPAVGAAVWGAQIVKT